MEKEKKTFKTRILEMADNSSFNPEENIRVSSFKSADKVEQDETLDYWDGRTDLPNPLNWPCGRRS